MHDAQIQMSSLGTCSTHCAFGPAVTSQDWIQFLLPPATLLFLLLPPLFCCPYKLQFQQRQQQSGSGEERKKGEGIKKTIKKGGEEIGARKEEGHRIGDVSEVIRIVP